MKMSGMYTYHNVKAVTKGCKGITVEDVHVEKYMEEAVLVSVSIEGKKLVEQFPNNQPMKETVQQVANMIQKCTSFGVQFLTGWETIYMGKQNLEVVK